MKKQRLWLLALFFLGVISFIQYNHRAPKRNFSDFHVTYTMGGRFLKGEPLYTFEKGLSYFKYPPFYAFFMGPFSLLRERDAARLWHLLNLFFLSTLFATVGRLLPDTDISLRPFIYLLAGVASFRIVLENLHEGQANLFMLTLLWGAIYFFSKGKDVKGGLLFAFSLLTKYLSVLFIPVFILERKIKGLAWTLLFLLLLAVLPSLVVGVEGNLGLLRQCRLFLFESSLDDGSISTPPNQSLLAFLNRLFYGRSPFGFHLLNLTRGEVFLLYFLLAGLLYLTCLISVERSQERTHSMKRLRVYGLVCLCMSLFNPNGWRNAFLPICIPYLLLFRDLLKEKWRGRAALVLTLLSFVLISLPSEFIVQEKGVKVSDLFSTVTVGTFLLFAALLIQNVRAAR